jgi:CBS domain-containing protein
MDRVAEAWDDRAISRKSSEEKDAAMQIKDAMTQPVVTCSMTSTLEDAARLMWECDCGIIPVVGDDGRLSGVVTDRDICMAAYTQGKPLRAIPVTTAMARQVVASHVGDGVEQVEALMRETQVRRVPVLDNEGRPVGIVSLNDLARLAARARRSGVDRELVQTLAAVCRPRTSIQASDRALVNVQADRRSAAAR